ncbi:hypothetical protein SISNIDRAFT_411937 [Sistotremastrum niveocremeum HHB9708]|uniref:Alpha/beta hydrolase fold-3 domain-containing protein n=1 Tax=Sistotremastrum niveocremeum HHB9708 TaxID=1314777 RepID=A0A164UFJ0_9AGAM|nr:hypothetical protein SISNIDRAFT_411937 [Sistotremastrum niveocremeum HHB9708]
MQPPRAPMNSSLSLLLSHYDNPGVTPPSARMDPQLEQRSRATMRLRDFWKLGAFFAVKTTDMTRAFVSHHIWGPKRKSWGIEMTMISSFMRNAGNHSQLTDVTTLRALMQLVGLVPVSSDALVTPVTFRVRKRSLRGFLAEFDAAETGSRYLQGEWVVGKKVWQRLQTEWRAAQSRSSHQSRHSKDRNRLKERVTLFLHGGAYFMMSPATHRVITIALSKYTESRVFAIDYRLAPETRFPGPLHDAVLAYLRLIEDLHIPPENILVAGDSAGGGLALALLMYLRDNQYPLPAGAILMSPWVDLTMSCDSWDSNSEFDVVPIPPDPADHLNPVLCYLGRQGMEKYLTHPYASPLFGDFRGLPALLIQAGEAEVLRDEITLLAHKAALSGVEVRHELYEDAVHVFQMFPFLDASRKSLLSCRDFVQNVLPLHQVKSPRSLDRVTETNIDSEINNERSRLVSGVGEIELPSAPSFEVLAQEETSDSSDEDTEEHPSWIAYSPVTPEGVLNDDVQTAEPHDHNLPSAPSPSSPDSEQTQVASWHSGSPKRNHYRHATSSLILPSNLSLSLSHLPPSRSQPTSPILSSPRPRPLSVASLAQLAPTPTIRTSHRDVSHPDITSLCKSWAESGPANQTTKFMPQSETESPF